jgi:hypothetical protein
MDHWAAMTAAHFFLRCPQVCSFGRWNRLHSRELETIAGFIQSDDPQLAAALRCGIDVGAG